MEEAKLQDLKAFYSKMEKEIEKEEWRRQLLRDLRINVDQKPAKTLSKNKSCVESLANVAVEALSESQLVQSLYQGSGVYERYTTEVHDRAQPMLSRMRGAVDLSVAVDKASKFEKSRELDGVFFAGVDEQWQRDTVVSFEQLHEEMLRYEPREEPEQPESSRCSFSSADEPLARPQPTAPAESRMATQEEEQLKRTFTQALMDFIAEVDKDPVSKFIQNEPKGSKKISFVTTPSEFQQSMREPSLVSQSTASLARHKAQSQTALPKRSYKTPDHQRYASKPQEHPNSRTPTATKAKPAKVTERQQTHSKSRQSQKSLTHTDRIIAMKSSNRSSSKAIPLAKRKTEELSANFSVMQHSELYESRQMADITNSPSKRSNFDNY